MGKEVGKDWPRDSEGKFRRPSRTEPKGTPRYPFEEMEVGDYFEEPLYLVTDTQYPAQHASRYGKKTGKKFSVRRTYDDPDFNPRTDWPSGRAGIITVTRVK